VTATEPADVTAPRDPERMFAGRPADPADYRLDGTRPDELVVF
jgi:hypothetical protein